MSDLVRRWTVVVPLKRADVGKSRLGVPAEVVRAIGLDTVEAAAAVARVIVVTADDHTAREALALTGVEVVRETGTRGLNAAITQGMPATGDRAVLLGDLPALRSRDLKTALTLAEELPRGVVSDHEGAGSTLVTAQDGLDWRSSFGEGSFSRHLALGCIPIDVEEESSLRYDVDTPHHWAVATRRGLGPRSAGLMSSSALAFDGGTRS